ncbi:hypothetical protein [Idiomarina abyssalis]|uniref:hypothetical protein n=1 Tax=Idiomarina abyssalis TaxID=86102 RepID=UPI003A8EE05F
MGTELNRASELYKAFELNRESLQLTHEKTAKAAKVVINILEFWKLKNSTIYCLFEEELSKYEQSSEYEFSDEFVFVTSLLLGIYADLRKLFLQDVHHLEWMSSPNNSLESQLPLVIISNADIRNIESLRLLLRSKI